MFLIPYLMCVALMSIPLYMFETGLGQITRRGRVAAWNRLPLMKVGTRRVVSAQVITTSPAIGLPLSRGTCTPCPLRSAGALFSGVLKGLFFSAPVVCQLTSYTSGSQTFSGRVPLYVPCCHHVPPCSRKSQCAKYHSIKSLENQN